MARAALLAVLLFTAGCGMSSGDVSEPSVAGESVFEAYRTYRSELIGLQRLPYADRNLSLLGSMATKDWAALDEAFLFEEPETIEQSDRDPEFALTVVSMTDDEAVLSVCRTQWRDLLYVDTGDRIGGGKANEVGSVVTMRFVDGSWLVDSDLFDQRQCKTD